MSDKRELSRSEQVRIRREQEHAKQLQRASTVTARSTSTVNTRAKQNAVKPVRKPARNPRRHFQFALVDASHSNMRPATIPRPQLGWRMLSFVVVAFIATLLYLAFTRPELRVTEAQLAGNQMLSQAEVNSALNIYGQPIFMITPSELENRLRLNFPELTSVQVSVSLPNRVSVNITERQPVVRWEQGGGYTWISDDGVAFRPHGEMSGLIPVLALSAPPVEGTAAVSSEDEQVEIPSTPPPFISPEMVQALKGIVSHAPPGAQIIYDKDFGYGWDDPRGWRVQLGTSANDVELKMLVYESMVSALSQKGIRPVLINVVYPSAPYYRMSQ